MNYLFNKFKKTRYRFIGITSLLSCLVLPMHNANAQDDELVRQMDRIDDGLDERIVGGTTVPAGERTFQVALLANGRQFCGGSIIADNWVLTAAHCITGGSADQILSGTRTLNQGGQRNSVVQTIRHPNYSGNIGAGNDVALIRINGTFANNLERLRLATPAIMSSNGGPGVGATVSGWGLTSGGGQASNRLLQTTNTIISDAQCSQLAGDINGATIICANDQGRSSCNGDSGGPLTITSGGNTYSAGVVSFGPQNCRGYSAYAQTSSFLSWIGQHVDTGGGGDGGNGGGDDDCSTDHQQVNGVIGNSGQKVVGGGYYFSNTAGRHIMTNVGSNPIRMRVQKWNSSRWVKVAGSKTQIRYDGTRGYHRMVLKGAVGSPYRVCFKRP